MLCLGSKLHPGLSSDSQDTSAEVCVMLGKLKHFLSLSGSRHDDRLSNIYRQSIFRRHSTRKTRQSGRLSSSAWKREEGRLPPFGDHER
jgi:hypothetical protein